MSIREPAADRYRVLRVKDIRGRGIVNNDGFPQVTPNLREIFDIVALVVVAAVSEQAMMDNIVDVQLVQEGVTVLGNGQLQIIST